MNRSTLIDRNRLAATEAGRATPRRQSLSREEAPRILRSSDEATCNTSAEFNIDGATPAGSATAPRPAE